MPKTFLSENISNILSIARLAPSVHNSQPWNVEVNGELIRIGIEPRRALVHGDPTGRQTYISLGIFAESCVVAANSLGGIVKRVESYDDGLISVLFGSRPGKLNKHGEDVKALKERFSDRSVHKKMGVAKRDVLTIEKAWANKTVAIKFSSDLNVIERCAELTRDGLLLALTNAEFRQELVDYLVPSAESPTGIPINTLQSGKLSSLLVKRLLASGLSRKHEAQVEYKRWLSASGLVFILAEGDSRKYWIESGRAYLRASLAIEKAGLAQATSAAIVEASDFHEDIEKLLGTSKRIECLIRVGKSNAKRQLSGRLSPDELLAT